MKIEELLKALETQEKSARRSESSYWKHWTVNWKIR